MSKESYYFSHDYGSRNDPKLVKVLMKLGQEGKGVYWDLIEMLYEQSGYLMLSDCDSYAFALRTDEACITRLVQEFGLFENDGERFWSKSVLSRMDKRDVKSQKAKQNALKRWNKTDSNANAVQKNANAMQSHSEPNALKEKKGKEIKRKEEEIDKEEITIDDSDSSNSDQDIPRPNAWGLYSSMDDLRTVLLSQKSWQSDFGISLGIQKPDDVPKWIEKFFTFCKGTGKIHEKQSDAKSHFHSWTRRQMELGKTVNDESVSKPNIVDDANPPDIPGTKNEERIGKWMWLNNGWRDTTTFAEHRKQHYGIK